MPVEDYDELAVKEVSARREYPGASQPLFVEEWRNTLGVVVEAVQSCSWSNTR